MFRGIEYARTIEKGELYNKILGKWRMDIPNNGGYREIVFNPTGTVEANEYNENGIPKDVWAKSSIPSTFCINEKYKKLRFLRDYEWDQYSNSVDTWCFADFGDTISLIIGKDTYNKVG